MNRAKQAIERLKAGVARSIPFRQICSSKPAAASNLLYG